MEDGSAHDPAAWSRCGGGDQAVAARDGDSGAGRSGSTSILHAAAFLARGILGTTGDCGGTFFGSLLLLLLLADLVDLLPKLPKILHKRLVRLPSAELQDVRQDNAVLVPLVLLVVETSLSDRFHHVAPLGTPAGILHLHRFFELFPIGKDDRPIVGELEEPLEGSVEKHKEAEEEYPVQLVNRLFGKLTAEPGGPICKIYQGRRHGCWLARHARTCNDMC